MGDLHLIFNGDDYGRTLSVNAAIIRAHEEGVLTSASLMVTGEAVAGAVAQARAHPRLAVGLHVVVAGARGALPPAQAPHLLDAQGQLPRGPVLAGIACFFSPVVRAELRRELDAQFRHFQDTGLALSHVDGHYHSHLHPTILPMLIPLAERYGAQGLRLPRDDLRLNLGMDRRRIAGKVAWASIYALLCRLAERQLQLSSLAYADRVYGFLQTGYMHEPYVIGLLRRIPPAVRSAEFYFHPSTKLWDEPYGPNPGDLAALLSPHVRQAIAERGGLLANYHALGCSRNRRMVCPGHYSS